MPSNKWEEVVLSILGEFEVAIMELVGDEFAPKLEQGSPERKRLLALLAETHKFKQSTKLALTNAVKELIETAKPWREYPTSDFADGIEAYQTNLLKAIGDTDD